MYDEEIIKQEGLSEREFFFLKTINDIYSVDVNQIIESLIAKGFMEKSLFTGVYHITSQGSMLLDNIDVKNAATQKKETDYTELAQTLQNMFPEGKKQGTNLYWKSNTKEVESKLKKFFAYYKGKYTVEQVIQATESYVHSFNGDYSFMRILKYFIMKKTDNGSELTSDLASYIENHGKENNQEWMTELR